LNHGCRLLDGALSNHLPLVDQLTRRDLLKDHLDGGPDRDIVNRHPRKVGVEVDARILIQDYQSQVVGLIGNAPVEPAAGALGRRQ